MSGPYSLNSPSPTFGDYGAMANYGFSGGGGLGVNVNQANPVLAASGLGGGAPIFGTPNTGAGNGFLDSMGGWFKDSGFLGSMDANGNKTQGWGGMALGAVQGLGSAFMGMKQYGLAKEAFNESKRQFQLNYDAQKQSTNTALEDRQRARVASNSGAYQSVGEYMSANGVK